jgi:hypothetical protein
MSALRASKETLANPSEVFRRVDSSSRFQIGWPLAARSFLLGLPLRNDSDEARVASYVCSRRYWVRPVPNCLATSSPC